jgi:hypothetical protein
LLKKGVAMKAEAGVIGQSFLPRNICACCNEPMYVVSIKRLLSGEGDWDVTFCCSSCDSETTAAISPPDEARQGTREELGVAA